MQKANPRYRTVLNKATEVLQMDWQEQLISVYLTICKEYQGKLQGYIYRTSNHSDLSFSDEEAITIYIFGIISGHFKLKSIYNYTRNHLRDWFPCLPGYVGFTLRINKISHLFEILVSSFIKDIQASTAQELPVLIDSMPIIMAQGGRRFKACVAKEIASNNGYCATKKLHYAGVKLHGLGKYAKGSLPLPMCLDITDAGTGDIKVLDAIEQYLPKGTNLFADKAYQRNNKPVCVKNNVTIYTPVKKQKGQERLDAADSLLSKAISSVRQPIESLFNWIEEKTKIQMASKVRSYEGLMVHIFGKLASALFLFIQKFSS